MAETPADTAVNPPSTRDSVLARFRVMVDDEAARIRKQIDDAANRVRAGAEKAVSDLNARGDAEIAELRRQLALIEQNADQVSRYPHGQTPAWAADKVLDKKVPHFMHLREDGSEPDEGLEVPSDE